jgi:hypothetical protein
VNNRSFQTMCLIILFASLGLLACDLSTVTSLALGSSKPQITIQAPLAGAQFREGDNVPVQSTATDKAGIVRVELSVDGAVVRSDAPPIAQGQTSFSVIQTWKATAGNHTLSVRAFNASSAASDPALITITVTAGAATIPAPTSAPTLPPLGGTPVNPSILLTPTLGPSGTTPIVPTITRTRTPAFTPTISAPPGVWALSVRVDPIKGTRGQAVNFFVTFLNSTGGPQTFRWRVRVYEPDKKNSFGDTATLDTSIPAGTSEQAAANNWKVTGPGDCLTFFARVFWADFASKQETEFLKPDQSGGPAAQFQVCP